MNDKHLPTPLPLRTALSDIAASAGGSATEGTAGTAEVHRMVRRSRRQRATALGAGGFIVLGVAGVGLSGLWAPLPEDVLPAPAVTPSPVESVEPLPGAFAPVCGDDLSDVLATTSPLRLAPNGARRSPVDLVNAGVTPLTIESTEQVAVYLLDAEGKVVATPAPHAPSDEPPAPLDVAPGGSAGLTLTDASPCAGVTLPAAGTHTALGLWTGDVAAEGEEAAQITVVGGPWIVTTDDAGRVTSIAGQTVTLPDAETQAPPVSPEPPPTDLPGAFDVDQAVFPSPITMDANLQCGQPAPAATGDDLLARLDVVGRVPALDGTSQPAIDARVTVHPRARVDVVDWFFLYEYVISQNGVIVSSPLIPTDTYGDVPLEPGQTVDSEFLLAATASCDTHSTNAPPPLAPGTYQLHATLPWMVVSYSLQQKDGTWGPERQARPGDFHFKGTLVSEPVTFTVR